jgi:hypothetical protein
MIAVPKPLRITGLFLANLFAAVVGTSMMDSGIVLYVLRPKTWKGALLAEELVSAVVAFGLGYFAYRTLKSATAKWVWVVGFCWFSQRILSLWLDQRMVRALTGNHGIALWGLPWGDASLDPRGFEIWISYSLPFVRTVFYSAGAFFCSFRASFTPLGSVLKVR